MFLCPICAPIYLYCSLIMNCCHFNVISNIAIKAGGLACHNTRFNPPFFKIKMSCSKLGKWPLLYIIVRFCVCNIIVLFFCCVVVLLFFLMCFPQFSLLPGFFFFFSQSIYEFRTAVYYNCLYWSWKNCAKNTKLTYIERNWTYRK